MPSLVIPVGVMAVLRSCKRLPPAIVVAQDSWRQWNPSKNLQRTAEVYEARVGSVLSDAVGYRRMEKDTVGVGCLGE